MAECTCIICGNRFISAGPGGRYCGKQCAPKCSFPGCDGLMVSQSLCDAHYLQARHGKPLVAIKRRLPVSECVVCKEPTGKKVGLRKFCSHSCESKWRRWGGNIPASADCIICGDLIVYGPREGQRAIKIGTRTCGKHRRRGVYELTSAQLAERDGTDCSLCGETVDMALKWPDRMAPTRDHIIPVTRGGSDAADNLRLAHFSCNVRKGNRVP